MVLTPKMSKFVASYQLTGNATEAAINAGYSVKTAPQAGCRMLKNPKIVNELEQWRVKKLATLPTKDDFIDMALKDYKATEITEPNRPRYLHLAGQFAGHIGVQNGGEQRPNQSLTINNIALTATDVSNPNELWDVARKLLEG